MTKRRIFEGAATAIITPLDENGINYKEFERLIEWQIAEGIDAIVVCGTTGEGSTLTDEEHKAAIKFCSSISLYRTFLCSSSIDVSGRRR